MIQRDFIYIPQTIWSTSTTSSPLIEQPEIFVPTITLAST